MILDYTLERIEITDKRELKLANNSKIIDIIYEVEAGDVVYTIGSFDRLMIFNVIREAKIKGCSSREMGELKLQYGMDLPDFCFIYQPKTILRALVPKPIIKSQDSE